MSNNSIQVWSPDTCECVIHQAYDDRLPPEERTFTYVTEAEAEAIVQARRDAGEKNINPSHQPLAKLCPAHAAIGAKPQLLATVQEENTRKNITHRLALEVMPALKHEDYKWAFDKHRNFYAHFPSMSASDKAKVKDKIDAEIGQGKVSVE